MGPAAAGHLNAGPVTAGPIQAATRSSFFARDTSRLP
jgi:hypothetical protein